MSRGMRRFWRGRGYGFQWCLGSRDRIVVWIGPCLRFRLGCGLLGLGILVSNN